MDRMYEGNQPCHGCGKTGAEVARLSKDGLCYDCQNQLEIGRAIAKERGLERNWYKMDELMVAEMTWYTIPVSEIGDALKNLLWTFSRFDSRYASHISIQESQLSGKIEAVTQRDRFVIPKETFEAAKHLCEVIKDVAQELKRDRNHYQEELLKQLAEQKNEIYNDGVKHGRNLLFQLNNNEITADEFIKDVKKY